MRGRAVPAPRSVAARRWFAAASAFADVARREWLDLAVRLLLLLRALSERRPGAAALPAAGFRERASTAGHDDSGGARALASNTSMWRCSPPALGLASWLIYKRRSRKGLVALSIFSLLYFGFWRKGCVCAIGSVQNVALALCDRGYAVPLGVSAFFVLPLAFALFAGRSFCAAVCPHGALQDLVLLKPVKVPPWLEQALSVLPYIYLGAGVLFAATGSAFIICQYDPFVPIFRMSGRTLMVLSGRGAAVAGGVRGAALLPVSLSLRRVAEAGRRSSRNGACA